MWIRAIAATAAGDYADGGGARTIANIVKRGWAGMRIQNRSPFPDWSLD